MMRKFRQLTLQRKQMLIIMLISTVSLLLACAAFVSYDAFTYRRELVDQIASLAGVVGNNTTAALDFDDPAAAGETLAALRGSPQVVQAHLHKPDGELFASYLQKGNAPFDWTPSKAGAHHVFRANHLWLVHPITSGGEAVGTIELVANLEELTNRLWRYAGIVALVFGGSLVVAFFLSIRLGRVISQPVLHLAQVARAVAQDKNYAVRAQKRSEDELGQLIDGFNEMLTQIQQRDSALQAARETLEHRVNERTGELAESLSLLHATLESTADGILALDLSGKITSFNSKFTAIWQFPAELLERRDLLELADYAAAQVTDAERLRARVHESRSHPEREAFDVFELKDGRVFERYALPQRITNQVVGVVVNWRDITQRKRATEAMAISEERFRSVWERSIEGMRLTDRSGRIVDVNEAFCRLTRMPREKLVGQVFSVTCRGHGPTDSIEAYIARFDSGSIVPRIEARVELWNTETLELEISSSLIESGQQGKMMLSTFRDVTERKRTDEQLKKAQADLVESSRLAGMAEVASNVLHNVGNVLNSVNVSATLVADNMKRSKAASLGRVVALLDEHTDDLGGFITAHPKGRQLPDYLRQLSAHMVLEQQGAVAELDSLRKNIEHIKDIVAMQQSYAKVSGVTEVLNVTDLIEDSLRMNSGALARHQVQVVREFQPVPPLNVEKHKVLQILVNLIRNAKYACDEGGAAEKRLTVRLEAEATRVLISVSDNGVGIPAENLTRIFNHGFTTRKDGHGFGLHSGALAAKEMGGALRVQSAGLGQGATFILELPRPLT